MSTKRQPELETRPPNAHAAPPTSAAPPPSAARRVSAFTVDVEDYYHVEAFANSVGRSSWDRYESRVVGSTHRILALLEEHQVRGTFFVLGWVARRHPQLVRDIQKAGHEIGCHSYWHRLVYRMTPEEFREDLVTSCDAIQQITGQKVLAYRAPCFSITQESLWALDILMAEGIRYDSSVFPVYHDHYGVPDAQRFPHRIERSGAALWEFPPTVYRRLGMNIPVAGGGYFRLYPAWLSLHWLGRVERQQKQPLMFYLHPWEVDPDQPRLPARWKSRFRHYQNLKTTEPKLRRLLARFSFGTLSESLAGVGVGVESQQICGLAQNVNFNLGKPTP